MILENKRHVCLFALAVFLGITLYCREGTLWLPLAAVMAAVTGFGLLSGDAGECERVITGLIVLGLAMAAFMVCRYQDHSYADIQTVLEDSPPSEISGRIYQKEIRSGSNFVYYIRASSAPSISSASSAASTLSATSTTCGKIVVYFGNDEIPVGAKVTVRGDIQLFSHATNEGEFDFADDYRYQNISCRIFADDMAVLSEPILKFREGLYRLKKNIIATFFAALNEKEAGVMATLTVGGKGLIDSEVKAVYQNAGISHILAISGLHISILGMGLYKFLRKIKCPCHVCEALGCAVILCFVIMCGMSVSSMRALIMYFVMMGARTFGRGYDSLNSLAIAALLLLIPYPMSIYRSGFMFSFTAIAAIVLYNMICRERAAEKKERIKAGSAEQAGGLLARFTGKSDEEDKEDTAKGRLSSLRGKFPAGLGQRCVMGAFLQLFLMPLTAWFYYEVPIYSMFLNLAVLPLCSALLGFGLAGGIIGMLFPQVAKWVLVPCHFILRIYEFSIEVTDRLPMHQWITGKPAAWLMFLYYAVLVSACCVYILKIVCRDSSQYGRVLNWYNIRFLHASAAGLLLALILFMPVRGVVRVDFLDVSQGDGIYISDGSGTNIMIDGGSSSVSSVGQYRIEPFLKYHQVRKVDAWILTHSDSDHYSGLLELLEGGYRINYLLLAAVIPRDETWETLVEAAEANGTEVVYVSAGYGLYVDGC